MLTFDTPLGRFNYRVAAVAIADGRVLLHQRVGDDFWALPGGRPEPMETAAAALRREMLEETGLDVTVNRLLWVVENFFTFEATPYHEVSMYFEVAIGGHVPAGDFKGLEGAVELVFKWCPLADLETLTVRPVFLLDELRRLPATPGHIVHDDR